MEIVLQKGAWPSRDEVPNEVRKALWLLRDEWGQQTLGASGPTLNIKKLTIAKGQYRLKVGDWRVSFLPVKDTLVVTLVGRRDKFYERLVRRGTVRHSGGLAVAEVAPPDLLKDRAKPAELDAFATNIPHEDNALIAFTDRELLALSGFGKGTLSRIRRIPGSVVLVDALAASLDDLELVQLLADMADDPARYGEIFMLGRVPSVDDATISEEEFAKRIGKPASSSFLHKVESREELDLALGGSLQDWMLFLDPSQKQLVEADSNGPSRLAGGPGTGKTVVAIRRALHWASNRDPRDSSRAPVLLTTYVNSLPKVWKGLIGTIAPTGSRAVTCRTVDSLAMGIVGQEGQVDVLLNEDQRRLQFARDAARAAGVKHAQLAAPDGLLAEFDHFIAGVGISELAEYLERPRTGAGFPVGRTDRETVYKAYTHYRKSLKSAGHYDFPSLRLRALKMARAGRVPARYHFSGVIVDEAQDLSAVSVQLLYALDISPGHSRFMLVADGRQSIYAGGYRLRNIGIEIGGRSRTLKRNWRNTWWISETTNEIAKLGQFDDIEDLPELEGAQQSTETVGEGEPVTLHLFAADQKEENVISGILRAEVAAGARLDGCCVLAWNNNQVKLVKGALEKAGIAVVKLDSNDDTGNAVRVGTIHRSKGLEFKSVILMGCDYSARPAAPPNDNARSDSRFSGDIRLAYVAFSRARDHLHIVSCGDPWSPIQGIAEMMQVS